MSKTSSRWSSGAALLLALLISKPASANHSHCDSWSDADFTEDVNQLPEVLQFIVAPERLDADLDYRDDSADKIKVDQVFKLDHPENIHCRKLAVQNGKISLREAAQRYLSALAKFRGCSDREIKTLIDHQRKDFAQKQQSAKSTLPEKKPESTPEKVERLNWAVELSEKTAGKMFVFVSGPSTGDEHFGSAVFKLKNREGKTVTKRVPVTSATDAGFCATTAAIERRLTALYEQEQSRMLAKLSDDGTAECLAWLSSNKEFNGKPAGTGLMSYLKVEPVNASTFHYDPNYAMVIETTEAGGLKKVTLRPYQSVDYIALVRDSQDHLRSAELFTPGVRKSRFGRDLFFNKVIQFDYGSGRCRPKSIDYAETGGKFSVSRASCQQVQDEHSPENWKKIESEMSAFLKAYQKSERNLASATEKKLSDSRQAFLKFCESFDFYLEPNPEKQ